MLDLFIALIFFICLILIATVIAIGILIIMLLKDIQREKEEDERSGI